jgi:hypothetical protein
MPNLSALGLIPGERGVYTAAICFIELLQADFDYWIRAHDDLRRIRRQGSGMWVGWYSTVPVLYDRLPPRAQNCSNTFFLSEEDDEISPYIAL